MTKLLDAKLEAQRHFYNMFKNGTTLVVGVDERTGAFYVPAGGLTVDPEMRQMFLVDAQRANKSGGYSKNSRRENVSIICPSVALVTTFETTDEKEARIAADKADAVEDAPEPAKAPKVKKAAKAPKVKKAKPDKAAVNKKAFQAASRKVKKAHPGASQDVVSTLLSEAVQNVDAADADAIFDYAVEGVCKSQVLAHWNDNYEEASSDEWVALWELVEENDADYADFDAVWELVDSLT